MDSPHLRPAPVGPPPALAPALPAGTVIAGRFTLEAPAGHGGMATVYRAMDSLLGQRVALKLLHPSPHHDSARRFTREAQLLATLHHPGIVSYVAHGHSEQGLPFLAMEWLEGEDLAQRLARQLRCQGHSCRGGPPALPAPGARECSHPGAGSSALGSG